MVRCVYVYVHKNMKCRLMYRSDVYTAADTTVVLLVYVHISQFIRHEFVFYLHNLYQTFKIRYAVLNEWLE